MSADDREAHPQSPSSTDRKRPDWQFNLAELMALVTGACVLMGLVSYWQLLGLAICIDAVTAVMALPAIWHRNKLAAIVLPRISLSEWILLCASCGVLHYVAVITARR